LHLKNIQLTHFKNYSESKAVFHPKMNIITGLNGTGKTNLIEAVYTLCIGKNPFSNSDASNMQTDADFYRITGVFSDETTIACAYSRRKKKILQKNGKNYDRVSQHLGFCPVILIAPDDIQIVKGGSLERRRLMDSTLCQISREYLEQLTIYNKLRLQRNEVLKNFMERRTFDNDLLATYTEPMVVAGKFIYNFRKKWLDGLVEQFQEYHKLISNERESVSFGYRSVMNEKPFSEIIVENLRKDSFAQRTTAGPHTDDWVFKIDDQALKNRGSQGQQKSFLVAIFLTLYSNLQEQTQKPPLLLLDDLFDKLDQKRLKALLKLVSTPTFGQVFITDTQSDALMELLAEANIDYQHLEIKEGCIDQKEKPEKKEKVNLEI